MLLYTGLLVRYTCYAAGGADSSGYLNAARMLAARQFSVRVTPLDALHLGNDWRPVFVPLGFADAPAPRDLGPSYPLGYPLHLMMLGALFGWKRAPFLVTPLAAALALVLTYRVARRLGIDRAWSTAAAALLGIAPTFFFLAVQPMSDVTATLWCTAAIYFALRAGRTRYAALCGVAFAIAVWVRPTNLLLALAIGFAMRWKWRPLAIAVAASMPFAIALMVLNHTLYGSALATGYGSVGEIVSLAFIPTHLPHYAKWLAVLETPLVFPAALFVAIDRRVVTSTRALLLVWFAAFLAFYICYGPYETWWYTRFLLPAFPPLLIGAMFVLRDIPLKQWRWVLVAIVVFQSLRLDRSFGILHTRDGEQVYPYAARWAEKLLPPNALPVSMQLSGALYFYDHRFSVRYDNLTPDRFQELRAYAGNAGLQWYAVVFEWELPELQAKMPGRWTKVATNRNVVMLRLAD